MKLRSLGNFALCIIAGLASDTAAAQPLHTDGRYFRDEQGAVVILRGLNVSGDAKVPPFRPIDDLKLLDPFPSWGVNVARLLFTWEAFEPEREQYDESYFAYYESIVDALHERGVRVIVDFHQDAFSRYATDGCGEGMPRWALSPEIAPREPDNGPDCAGWGLKFITNTETHKHWNDFYADVNGVRTAYLKLLGIVAERLGNHPAVLGWDMLNEPWGNEEEQIAPLYRDAAQVIRAHDPDGILFVSPQALTSSGQDTQLPKPAFTNFAYSPHYYDGSVILFHRWLGGSVREPVERMWNRANSWDVPLFLGEFGAPGDGNNVEPYMEEFYKELDARFISSAQWSFVAHWDPEKKDGWNVEDFSIQDDKGTLRQTYRVRPYPARIAGDPISYAVERGDETVVTLTWNHEPALGATRIFAPFLPVFGAQAKAEAPSDVRCTYEHDRRHVRCTSDKAGEKTVRLSRCADASECLEVAKQPADDEVPVGGGDGGAGDSPMGSVDGGVTDAGSESVGTIVDIGGGGGCALPGPRHRNHAFFAFVTLALVFATRRRGRAR